MGSGNHNPNGNGNYPAHHCLYSKMKLGWITTDEIYYLKPGEVANIHIVPLETPFVDPAAGYYYGAQYTAPTGGIYMFEYHAPMGSDIALPDAGLLVSILHSYPNQGGQGVTVRYLGGNNETEFGFIDRNIDGVELSFDDNKRAERSFHWESGDNHFSASLVGMKNNSLDVILDMNMDYGEDWIIEDLAPGNSCTYDFENIEINETMLFNWDGDDIDASYEVYNSLFTSGQDQPLTPDAATFLFQYDNGIGWDTLKDYTDKLHGTFEYRALKTGDYRVIVINDDDDGDIMHLRYFTHKFGLPTYNITIDLPETAYMINDIADFDFNLELKNLGEGWIDYENSTAGNITYTYPAEIIPKGESGSYTINKDAPIFYNHPQYLISNAECSEIGTYTISVDYEDVNISTTISGNIEILYDTIAPSITLEKTKTQTKETYFDIFWNTIEEETGVDRYEVYLDDVLVDTLYLNYDTYRIDLPDVDGTYKITVKVFDRVNNLGEDSMMCTYDGTKPVITLDIDIYWIVDKYFEIFWNTIEEETGVDRYEIYLDEVLIDTLYLEHDNYGVELPDVEGTYKITVKVFDMVNNMDEDSMMCTYDGTKPVITLDIDNDWTRDNYFEMFWNTIEEETGVDRYEIYLDEVLIDTLYLEHDNYGVELPDVEGSYNITIKVFDRVNNSDEGGIMCTFDSTNPIFGEIVEDPTLLDNYSFAFNVIETLSPTLILKITLGDYILVNEIISSDEYEKFEVGFTPEYFTSLGINLIGEGESKPQFRVTDRAGNYANTTITPIAQIPRFATEPTVSSNGSISFTLEESLFANSFQLLYSKNPITEITGEVEVAAEFTTFIYEGNFTITEEYYIAAAAINQAGASISETIQISIFVSKTIPGYLNICTITLMGIVIHVFYLSRKIE
jgi:hypothetical protein